MDASLTPSGFFVLRAPLLPLEELDRLRADPDYWQSAWRHARRFVRRCTWPHRGWCAAWRPANRTTGWPPR